MLQNDSALMKLLEKLHEKVAALQDSIKVIRKELVNIDLPAPSAGNQKSDKKKR